MFSNQKKTFAHHTLFDARAHLQRVGLPRREEGGDAEDDVVALKKKEFMHFPTLFTLKMFYLQVVRYPVPVWHHRPVAHVGVGEVDGDLNCFFFKKTRTQQQQRTDNQLDKQMQIPTPYQEQKALNRTPNSKF